MKKILSFMLLSFFMLTQAACFAEGELKNEDVKPPVWEEYVPSKYQNPRSFPNKGKNIAELSVGIFLTDLIITCPIGIPMTVHATTKLKNQGWYEKKQIYDAGIIEGEKIEDPYQRKVFYEKLKKQCNLTEKKHKKQMKRLQKQQAKNNKQ